MYSSTLRKAIGLVRQEFDSSGLERQSSHIAHGVHDIADDAPLVLVACSGGRDSLALTLVAKIVADMYGLRCQAVHINHQLNAHSTEVAENLEKILHEHDIAVQRIDVTVQHTQSGLEADARQARYEALIRYARTVDARLICVAHTQDDQAETVLLKMLRTQSTYAMQGMRHRIIREGIVIVRPWLETMTREDTTTLCREFAVEWWDDPTNGDLYDIDTANQYSREEFPLRSEIRQRIMPVLQELSHGSFARHVGTMATLAQEEHDALQNLAEKMLEATMWNSELLYDNQSQFHSLINSFTARHPECEIVGVLSIPPLLDTPSAVTKRVIALFLEKLRISNIQYRHILSIYSLIADWHGQGFVNLPRYFSAFHHKQVILICHDSNHGYC